MSRYLLIGLAGGLAASIASADPVVVTGSSIPVEAFFGYAKVSSAKISPSGKYLATVVADDASGSDRKYLSILGSDDRKLKGGFQVPEGHEILTYWWVNDERVVVSTATQTGGLSAATRDDDLYAINVDGTQAMHLLGYVPDGPAPKPGPEDTTKNFTHIQHKDGDKQRTQYYFDGMLHVPREDTHHVLVEGWASNNQHPLVLDVDVYAGDVKVVTESPLYNGAFLADADGHVRVTWGVRDYDGVRQVFYRGADDSAEWKDLSALYKGVDPADYDTGPLMVAQDGKTFYWRGRSADSTLGLYRVDPADISLTPLFSDPAFDMEGYDFGDFAGNRHTILAVETYPGLRVLHAIEPKDPETAILLALQQAFAGQKAEITSTTRDGATMIVYVTSDHNPGDYYLFNSKTLKADWLFSALEQIDPDKMADMRPVELKARDGVTLHGYLTAPPGKPQKNLPLILLPHGGPHNIRDYWGWDAEAQYFASRGYAVLQVNFRGSGGYGLKFQQLGYRNWGTTMQDDLADAVHWVVNQGIADAGRICIYGASYGGYAALENPIRYPDLYKCAIGYVGVYDLTLEAKYGDVHRSASGRNYLEIVRGNDQAELKKYSPVYNVDKLTVPVFIAYGGKDQRVVPDNAKELRAALDKAGKKYEYLFDPYEVHGFLKPEDKFEFYTRVSQFIDANMGIAAPAEPATGAAKPGAQH